jgi:hypothetical protein
MDDGRWLALGIVGTLAAVALVSRSGSSARDPYVVNVVDTRNGRHVRIRRDDKSEIRTTWNVMQGIKDRVLGQDVTAVEVYPARRDLVDEANIRHLWSIEELPFGLHR